MQTEEKSTRYDTCYFPKRSRFDFRFSCNLQGHFACTLRHRVPDRIGLLQSAPCSKLTTTINGLVPQQIRHKQNTEGTYCVVKELHRSRVYTFRSSLKINSRKGQYSANETENQFTDYLSASTKQRGVFARGLSSLKSSRKSTNPKILLP